MSDGTDRNGASLAHDVIVVGGGPAGCSTALFTARYGLDTVVFDHGSSSIRQCAFIENYLGFPGGIDVETFYAASQAQAERAGATVRDELVERVERRDDADGFRVETGGGSYTAGRVVAASTYDVSYLESVLGEHFESEDGETWLDPELAGERGGTPVDGLWLAGPTGGVESQIAVAVGHGARVGLAVVTDYREAVEGLWPAAADHTDWVVQQGRYEGEEWLETVTEYHLEDAPDDRDEAAAWEQARELAAEQQAWQIDDEEVARRRERGHRALAKRLDTDALVATAAERDPEAVLDALDDEAIRSYAADIDGDPRQASDDG